MTVEELMKEAAKELLAEQVATGTASSEDEQTEEPEIEIQEVNSEELQSTSKSGTR